MVGSKKSTKVYESIGNHIDKRVKGSTTVIGGIKGNLFDLLTLGDDDSRKEIGQNIKQEIEAKIKATEDKIFSKHGSDKKAAREEIERNTYIQSLYKIKGDLNLRINNNKKSSNERSNNLLDLDKNQGFNNEVLENIANEIINECRLINFEIEGSLFTRLLTDKEIKQTLLNKIKNKMNDMGDLTDNQRKNLKKIIEKLDGEGTYIEKREKAKSDLKKKLDDMKLYGKPKVDITDPIEIEERLNNLAVGDIIFYKYERKTGKRKEGIPGMPRNGERPGMGGIGDRYRVIKKGLDIVELLNITMKNEGYNDDESTLKLSIAKIVSEKDKIEKIWILNNSGKPKKSKTPTKTGTKTPTKTGTTTNTGTETPTKTGTKTPTKTGTTTNTGTETPTNTGTTTNTGTETPTNTGTTTNTGTETPTNTGTTTNTGTETPTNTGTTTNTESEDDLPTSFEVKENAVLSDVSESYEDMISRMVENEINEEWHNTSKFNVFKRGKLFLMRGKMRKKKIEEMKKKYEKTPFTNNGTFNREMAKQAARHDLEEILGKKGVTRDAFGKIKRESLVSETEVKLEGRRGKEFKEICQEYVAGTISQVEFQDKFNKFVKKLGAAVNQKFLATNVLEKLDAIKNDNELLKSITADLEKYLGDHNNSHFDSIRTKIDADFKKYKRDPRFRAEILNILGNTSGLTKEQLDEKINKFIRHQKALAKMSTQNLQIKLDLLTNGKGAYQTNNKDRENWLFRFGNKLDKMPRWGQALTVAGISASGMLVGGAVAAAGASAFAAGLAGTATLSGLVGAKNFVKKWTHHTKEQNTYEKNLTRNYEEEIAKMKERERIMSEKNSEGKYTNGWFKRYKAKRQLELYGKATQEHLQNENEGNTKELSDFIYTALERYDSLNADEKNALNCTLLDAKARLETYWAKGHNFLKSKDKNQIEKDFYDLENALNLSANRILGAGASLKEISQINAYDASGKAVNYNDLLDLYKKDYNSASKKFRGERAWLATKWGIGTAAITFGTSAAIQAISGTGMFAKDAVAGTPGTPDSTSTTNTGTVMDNYGMGKYELSGGNKIFQAAQDNISGLNSTDTVTLHLGSGTDGTAVRAGSSLLNHATYLDKLDQVKDVIAHSSLSNKADLIRQINSGFSTSGFTNTDLHGMRCLEAIEETVKGAGNFAGNLNISYDTALNIDGAVAHDAASRMSQAFLEISQFIPGEPGREAVKGGAKWLVLGLPRFSNTFKRNNDGKPGQKPVSPVIDEPKDKPKDKPTDGPTNKPTDEPTDKPTNKPTDKPITDKPTKPGTILPPVKIDNPAGVTVEEPPRKEIKGKVRGVVTRGHQINVTNEKGETVRADIDDLGENYPGTGKLLDPKEAANLFLEYWKNGFRNHFTKKDADRLEELNGNEDAQRRYLESLIISEREFIENSETMKKFNESKEISKKWIKKFLPELIGNVDSELVNNFLSDDRIHVVSDRDYLGITGSIGSDGCFRNLDGDIFIRYSVIEQTKDHLIHGDNGSYSGFYRHSILIHEMIHSMSALNYFVSGEDNKLVYDQRRIGLRQTIRDKNGKYLGETGRSLNEASTESLSWEILARGFNSLEGNPDISYLRERHIAYKGLIDVIDQLEDTDNIKYEDFWKAMLIRKRAKGKAVEINTPLFELVGKVNGREEENGHVEFKRPDYYSLISNSMDFSHELFNEKISRNQKFAKFDTNWIIKFIKTKDLSVLKDYIESKHRKLSDVFDKGLLKKDGSDFKKEILDAYDNLKS